MTNRPVVADRVTLRRLLVPAPTRSVVVLVGHRAAEAFDTNRPVLADLFTERRAIARTSFLKETRVSALLLETLKTPLDS